MNDRDRLIELLCEVKHYESDDLTYSDIENIADYLLANGVIVPPCKVGDMVYFVDTCLTVEDFGTPYINFERVHRISYDTKIVFLCDERFRWWKDVFLTKEEAERALKEREGE